MSARTLKEKQQRQKEIDEKYFNALKTAKKEIKVNKKPKKLDINLLASWLVLDITDGHIIRPISTYPNRSYNADKQMQGLIRHLYVKYPTPIFLYEVCKKGYKAKHPEMHADYLLWFLALAQGKSFTKLAKPYMTAKECHYFLSAPYGEIHNNVWWAKLKAAGIPANVSDGLIDKIFKNQFFVDPTNRLNELIVFYAHHHQEMDKTTLGEVNDYINWVLVNEPEFRFKGRTAASMINLSNEWHRLMQKAKLGKFVEWDTMNIPSWTFVDKHSMWTMDELVNNKELANEGRKQKHCVYGYVSQCINGNCNIFSLREHSKECVGVDDDEKPIYQPCSELNRITVEIRNRSVVQVRGHLNRSIESRERNILRIWCCEKGITISGRH